MHGPTAVLLQTARGGGAEMSPRAETMDVCTASCRLTLEDRDEFNNVFLSPKVVGAMATAMSAPGVGKHPKKHPTAFTFTPGELSLCRRLGSGGFGSVYLANVGQQAVAVKRLHSIAACKNQRARVQSFQAELVVLRLHHPNLVRMLAYSEPDRAAQQDAFIVMEFAGERDLQQVINAPDEELEAERRLRYSRDIAAAISYVHENHIAHLDIKPANVIITPEDSCKVGDFGCCQLIEDQLGTGMVSPTQRSELTGTMFYRAPELLRGRPPTSKADVFSFGVTMWAMQTREVPYEGEGNQHAVIFQVVSRRLRPRITSNVDLSDPFEECYVDLYRQCWDAEPSNRPSAQDLVHVFTTWRDCFSDPWQPP